MGAQHQPVSYLDLYSHPNSPSRDIVPLTPITPPAESAASAGEIDADKLTPRKPTLFGKLTDGLSLRQITPRQMAGVSLDLYAAGVLTYDDYAQLAFQPELHPDYNTTVGALTGEIAGPDRARDFVAQWEERLNFEQRYYPQNTARVRKTERIVQILHRLDGVPKTENPTLAA